MSENIEQPNRLDIGDENDPWAEISRYEPLSDHYVEPIKDDKLMKALGDWIQPATELAKAAKGLTSNNLYVMKLNPQLSAQFRNGSLGMMSSSQGGIRGVVVDGNGIIRGQASWYPAKGMSAAAFTNLAWQAMAVMTAQHFLPEINRQLDDLNKKLDGIKDFLDKEKKAELRGTLVYLVSILAQPHQSESRVAAIKIKLEDIEHKTYQHQEFYGEKFEQALEQYQKISLIEPPSEGIKKQLSNLKKLAPKILLTFKDDAKIAQLEKHLKEYQKQSEAYLLTLAVRVLEGQIMGALPGYLEEAEAHVKKTKTQLLGWSAKELDYDYVTTVKKAEFEKLALFSSDKLRQGFEKLVNDYDKKGKPFYKDLLAITTEITNQVQARIAEATAPLQLVIEVDASGKPISVGQLLKA